MGIDYSVVGWCGSQRFGAVKRRDDGLVAVALVIGGVLPLTVSATGISHYLVPVAPGFALMVGILARSLGQRVVVEVVAAVVLAGAFIVANGKDLLRPDYSSGTQAICEGLNQAGLQTAGTWNLHDPAVTWYCNDFKGYLYADNPGFWGNKGHPHVKGLGHRSRRCQLVGPGLKTLHSHNEPRANR